MGPTSSTKQPRSYLNREPDIVSIPSESQPNITKKSMETYYSKFFPASTLFHWLNPASRKISDTSRREYCPVLQTPTASEVFCRYTSVPTMAALKGILRRNNEDEIVIRMEIGPVYNREVTECKLSGQTVEREFIFDIDMDDYDDTRFCCDGKKVCDKCFQFLIAAAKVLHHTLQDGFGFEHLFFVFSGRRGMHCWVSDKQARELTNEGRGAVASYINLNRSNILKLSQQELNHYMIRSALNILKPMFSDILYRQGKFKNFFEVLHLALKNHESLVNWLSTQLNVKEHIEVWEGLINKINSTQNSEKQKEYNAILDRIILYFLYPRLDIEVSKQTNHLLKSPFCIHPATGKVCVPIDISTIDNFSPDQVPTLTELIQEVSNDGNQHMSDPQTPAISQRSKLTPYIQYFDSFVDNLTKSFSSSQVGEVYEEKSKDSLEW